MNRQNTMVAINPNQIRDQVLMMGGAAEKAIARATRSLIERDSDLAERVIQEDDAIDRMEVEIDAMCADLLLNRQPASFDLRVILSIVSTAPVVERIADHAVNVAKHAL